jgi:hypothetical protein
MAAGGASPPEADHDPSSRCACFEPTGVSLLRCLCEFARRNGGQPDEAARILSATGFGCRGCRNPRVLGLAAARAAAGGKRAGPSRRSLAENPEQGIARFAKGVLAGP